eukprot:UN25917
MLWITIVFVVSVVGGSETSRQTLTNELGLEDLENVFLNNVDEILHSSYFKVNWKSGSTPTVSDPFVTATTTGFHIHGGTENNGNVTVRCIYTGLSMGLNPAAMMDSPILGLTKFNQTTFWNDIQSPYFIIEKNF